MTLSHTPSTAFLLTIRKIGPPFPSLSIERKRFTAGLDLDEHGVVKFTGHVKGEPHFVGTPSREIDANWDYLIRESTT